METKAISIAKLTPLGVAVILATIIISLSINANHAEGWGIATSAGNMTNSTQPLQPLYQPQIQQQPNSDYAQPRILSQSAYTDSIGTVHIVGEVLNQSPVTAKFVEIIVTFYNAYNQVIGTDFTFTQPSDLAPGQRAPFDIAVLSGGIPMAQVRNYALSVDAS